MIIELVTDKYYLWRDGSEYVVTTRKRRELFKGTLENCKRFMEKHPYGVGKGVKANESIV